MRRADQRATEAFRFRVFWRRVTAEHLPAQQNA